MVIEMALQDVLPILSAYGILTISFISLIVTITYFTINVRYQNEQRRVQLFMQIYSRFNDNQFWENNLQMMKNLDLWEAGSVLDSGYLIQDPQGQAQFNAYASFYEGIGVLVKRKFINLELVKDLMSSTIVSSWEAMSPVIERLRDLTGDDSQYKGFEYIYTRVKETTKNT